MHLEKAIHQVLKKSFCQVSLERHGNSARLALDRRHEEQGSAPGINDVLNLNSQEGDEGSLIYFGAKSKYK